MVGSGAVRVRTMSLSVTSWACTSCQVRPEGTSPPQACVGAYRAVSHTSPSAAPAGSCSSRGGDHNRSSTTGSRVTAPASQTSISQPLSVKICRSGNALRATAR